MSTSFVSPGRARYSPSIADSQTVSGSVMGTDAGEAVHNLLFEALERVEQSNLTVDVKIMIREAAESGYSSNKALRQLSDDLLALRKQLKQIPYDGSFSDDASLSANKSVVKLIRQSNSHLRALTENMVKLVRAERDRALLAGEGSLYSYAGATQTPPNHPRNASMYQSSRYSNAEGARSISRAHSRAQSVAQVSSNIYPDRQAFDGSAYYTPDRAASRTSTYSAADFSAGRSASRQLQLSSHQPHYAPRAASAQFTTPDHPHMSRPRQRYNSSHSARHVSLASLREDSGLGVDEADTDSPSETAQIDTIKIPPYESPIDSIRVPPYDSRNDGSEEYFKISPTSTDFLKQMAGANLNDRVDTAHSITSRLKRSIAAHATRTPQSEPPPIPQQESVPIIDATQIAQRSAENRARRRSMLEGI